jgi:hypothetical protein
MNRNFLLLLSGMLFADPFLAHAAESTPASAFAARAKQTSERLEILFRHRDEAPVSFSPSQNPFRTPNDAPAATDDSTIQPTESTKDTAPTSEEALLKAAVATLKISGTVVVSDQINVSINQETYREGSVIIARVQGIPVYLRIRRITNNGVTFVLNQLELVQPF